MVLLRLVALSYLNLNVAELCGVAQGGDRVVPSGNELLGEKSGVSSFKDFFQNWRIVDFLGIV